MSKCPHGRMTVLAACAVLGGWAETYGTAHANEPEENPATQPAETRPAEEEESPGLLRQALKGVGLKPWIEKLGLRVYGYVEAGFTGRIRGGPSLHEGRPRPSLFLRGLEGQDFNNLLLNQIAVGVTKDVDTKKPFDWGGTINFLYGSDARYSHAYGLFDEHSIGANPPFAYPPNPYPFNHDNLPDVLCLYAESWVKTGSREGEGLDVIFGKFGTSMGVETFDATVNYLYSHSMLFTYAEPATHTGVKATYRFDQTSSAYIGAVRGWDVWKDNNRGASWMGGFALDSKEKIGPAPKTQFTFHSIAGPEQFSDPRFSGHGAWHAQPGNRMLLQGIWTYRFNEKMTQIICGDFGYEDNVPWATDHRHLMRTRDSDWEGVAYYLNYVFNDYLNATARAEWFRDHYGARTGYPGNFYEVTLGVGIRPWPKDKCLKHLTIRPEVRWDFSANNEPFAGRSPGSGESQMTAAVDVVYGF